MHSLEIQFVETYITRIVLLTKGANTPFDHCIHYIAVSLSTHPVLGQSEKIDL